MTETHHVKGRHGSDPHDPEWLLGVCRFCHDAIHRNSEFSRQKGWMVSRLGRVGQFTEGLKP